jgi:D-glycero-D-manno-heptose 1,7-bisphosphate phosphatase
VFLDRDGTLNHNVWNPRTGAYESPLAPEHLEILPGTIPALQELRDAGYLLVLVSNQPNFAKGKATMQTLEDIHRRLEDILQAQKIFFTAFYYCLHHPDFTGECVCRKPSPYFLFQARDKFSINFAESWMVGDRITDVECGYAAGVNTVLLTNASEMKVNANHLAADLCSAARIILDPHTLKASAGLRHSM